MIYNDRIAKYLRLKNLIPHVALTESWTLVEALSKALEEQWNQGMSADDREFYREHFSSDR